MQPVQDNRHVVGTPRGYMCVFICFNHIIFLHCHMKLSAPLCCRGGDVFFS